MKSASRVVVSASADTVLPKLASNMGGMCESCLELCFLIFLYISAHNFLVYQRSGTLHAFLCVDI